MGWGQRQGSQQPTRPLSTCLVVAMEDSSRLPALWSHLVTLHPWGERHCCRCTGRHTWRDRPSGLRLWGRVARPRDLSQDFSHALPPCTGIFLAPLVRFLPEKLWVPRCAWAVSTCKSEAGARRDQGWEEEMGTMPRSFGAHTGELEYLPREPTGQAACQE